MDHAVLPQTLAPGLHRLGSYHLACFLVETPDAALLFETGMSLVAPLILAQLDELGVPREKIRWIVHSHAHSDHSTGQAALLEALPRAELLLSPASCRHLAKPSTAEQFAKEDDSTRRALEGMGALPPGPLPDPLPLLPARHRTVEPGDTLDLGGLTVELRSAAGHVPGGLLAWLPELGAFLASDSAGFHMAARPNYPLYFTGYREYLRTLEEIRRTSPELLCLGHQGWFRGGEARRYLEALKAHLAFEHATIWEAHRCGEDEDSQARRLMERYYHDELAIYPEDIMWYCCRLLVRRSLEAGA